MSNETATSVKMNKRKLLGFAKRIRKVNPENLSLESFYSDTFVNEKEMKKVLTDKNSGITGCAFTFLVIFYPDDFKFENGGPVFKNKPNGGVFGGIREYFGINLDEYAMISHASKYPNRHATPEKVAERIEEIVNSNYKGGR